MVACCGWQGRGHVSHTGAGKRVECGFVEGMSVEILNGDWVGELFFVPDKKFHCCVTSPPYWGLRNYGVSGQIGQEKTPGEYVQKLVEGFRVIREKLCDDGTIWLNLGDS